MHRVHLVNLLPKIPYMHCVHLVNLLPKALHMHRVLLVNLLPKINTVYAPCVYMVLANFGDRGCGSGVDCCACKGARQHNCDSLTQLHTHTHTPHTHTQHTQTHTYTHTHSLTHTYIQKPWLFSLFYWGREFDKVCESSRTLKLFEGFDVQFWETGPWAPPPTFKSSQLVVDFHKSLQGQKGGWDGTMSSL